MNALGLLRQRFVSALLSWVDDLDEPILDGPAIPFLAELVLPSQDARFGDYQANCAMPLGKRLGRPPREVAEQLVAGLQVDDFCEPPTIAGPGFINVRLKDSWLIGQLQQALVDDQRLGVQPVASPRTYVIDYSSSQCRQADACGPYPFDGDRRRAVPGAAIPGSSDDQRQPHRRLGHPVRHDHLWLQALCRRVRALQEDTVAELSRLYQLVHGLIEYHDIRRQRLPALQQKIAEQERKVARQTRL